MKPFNEYLKSKGYAGSTITNHVRRYNKFNRWLKEKALKAAHLSYDNLLEYVEYCRELGNQKSTIVNDLNMIYLLLEQLREEGKVKENISKQIKLKNIVHRLPDEMLTREQQEQLYNDYKGKGIVGKRNKVIVGLFVYQGVRRIELTRLECNHLELREGKINIPGGNWSNSRTLQLEAHQVIEMYDYVEKVRPLLLAISGTEKPYLIASSGASNEVSSVLDKINNELKKQFTFFKSLDHLRQSVITYWTKAYEIRKAQVLAGHKKVRSTERYRVDNLEELQESLNKFHPLQ